MASILIAEDRAVDRLFLTTLLGYQGHTILEAGDGAEALAVVQSARPDLVISDVLMPTMDGYEFVRRMRAIPAVAATPVIFYTATYHEREARVLAERCGVRDIITKPSEPELILARVEAVLGRARPPADVAPPDAAEFHENHVQLINQKLSDKVQRLAETEHRLAALIDIGHRLSQERDPHRVLQQVCSSARSLTLAKHVDVAILSDDGTLVLEVVTSGGDPSRSAPVDDGDRQAGLLSQMLKQGLPVRRRTVDGATGVPVGAGELEGYSYLGVPVATATASYGWLSLTHKLGADDFTDTDERMAVALAGQAGLAYENARQVSQLEQEIAERTRLKSRMDFALAAARMGVAETALDTRRVLWSDTTAALFGIAPEMFAGTVDAFYALVHPDDRVPLREEFGRALLERKRDLVTEFRTVWPDGSTRWLQTRARITYDPKGQPLSVIDVSLDITDRKLLEAQFRQAQKMEAVGLLASGIAHDFNNLLTVIGGYAEFMRDGLAAGPMRNDAEEIIQAARRAGLLTGKLLAFSRKQVVLPTRLDLNAVVANVGTMLRRLIGDHIELQFALDAAPSAVRADESQLEQVVINLAVNARDAMGSGGRITIETATVELGANATIGHDPVSAGSYVRLSVSDTGSGMDQQTKDRLFEPFFTTKAVGKGTGLGLAAVHGIITQSGGAIAVESEPLRGTSFRIYLPAAAPLDEAASAIASPKAAANGSASVLIVEDEQAIRSLTRTILERADYRVLAVSTVAEAEACFANGAEHIDLLLTDVALPDGTGPALFKRMFDGRPLLRVLYMSGYADQTVVDQGALVHAGGFLQKPFRADRLVSKVREALAG